MINKPNHRSLSLILGFSITVTIWPREVLSCRDFILRSVATLWVMSLVGIYPCRASNKVMTNYPQIALPKPNILILSRAPSNFLYICDNRRSLNVFPGHPTFCCTCKKRLALAWENSQHNCFPRKMRLRNSLLMILRVACYVSCLKTAEAAYQTVFKARFRRRSTHVPNPTEALSTAKEWHLNQFGMAVLIWCNKNVKFNRVCRNIRHWSGRWFIWRSSHVPNQMHTLW